MDSKHEIVKTDADLPIRFFYSNDGKRSYVIPHFHDDIELMCILTGSITITRNTMQTVLKPGDIAVFNPNIIHSTLSDDPETTAYVLQISYDFLRTCQEDKKQIFFDIPQQSKETTVREKSAGIDKLKTCLALIHSTYLDRSSYFNLKLHILVYEITYTLFHTFSAEENMGIHSNQFKHFKRLSVITTYIKENYSESISLGDMADLISVTPAYLSRFFKKTLGMTFLEYTTLVRLEHAYTDIVTTDYPITYISDKNGFANYPLFNQKFKQKYGCTPLKLRKRAIEDHIMIYGK